MGSFGSVKKGVSTEELSSLPKNYDYTVGQVVRYVDNLHNVLSLKSGGPWRIHRKINPYFYDLESSESVVVREVPYFMICPNHENIFVDQLVFPGSCVKYAKKHGCSARHQGRVLTVHHVRFSLPYTLDILDESTGKVQEGVPPDRWKFDLGTYTAAARALGAQPGHNMYNPGQPRETPGERTERLLGVIFEQSLQRDIRNSDNRRIQNIGRAEFDLSISSPIYLQNAEELHLDLDVVRKFKHTWCDRSAKLVVEHLGYPWQLHIVNGKTYRVEYTKTFPPGFVDEIEERALIPTFKAGEGGALFREAARSFNA